MIMVLAFFLSGIACLCGSKEVPFASWEMSGLHPTTIEETTNKTHVSTMPAVARFSNDEGGFVKAVDRKARRYLETIKRSFSSSSVERCEDPTSLTIEFLWGRLQAQRSKYEAEKLRSQQLAKKIQELEQKLNFENELRRKTYFRGNMALRDGNTSWELQHLTLEHSTSEELNQEISSSLESKENILDSTKDEDHNSDVHSVSSSFDGRYIKCSCCHCHCHFNVQNLETNCQHYASQEKSDIFKCNRKLLVRSESEGIRKNSINPENENDECIIYNMNSRYLSKLLIEGYKQDPHQKSIESFDDFQSYSIYDIGTYSAHKPFYSDLKSMQHISSGYSRQNVGNNVKNNIEGDLRRPGENSLGMQNFLHET